ncbi:hypothetical protein MBLNU230_g0632t1 [Neophaeotheca triangularis]
MLQEGAELTGESGTIYLAVSPLGQSNVWTGVQKDDPTQIVVLKEPGTEDCNRPGWPSFMHEMIMHELLRDSPTIRRSIDRIPPAPQTTPPTPPMLVLEIFQTTLWTARTKRPLTKPELRHITKTTLLALRDIHAKDLVYADLKMQNIMLNNFSPSTAPSDPSTPNISVKLGDLGIVMSPKHGQVQPIAYRAPEVYFKGQITQAADIWSWGLIYSHLLEAQTRFQQTGIYDALAGGTAPTVAEREDATKTAIASDYNIRTVDYYNNAILPSPAATSTNRTGHQWDVLHSKGLEDGEIRFLRWVMKADPRERPTADEILESGWLDDEGTVKTRHGLKSFAPLGRDGGVRTASSASGGSRPVSRSSFFRSESDPVLDALSRQVSAPREREGDGDAGGEAGDGGDGDAVTTPTAEKTQGETVRPAAQRTFLSYR